MNFKIAQQVIEIMKANELMIGDWVISKDLKVPVKVRSIMNHYGTSIYFYHNGSEFIVQDFQIEPIPLTTEILEKNGFDKVTWWKRGKNDVTTYISDGFQIQVNEDGTFSLVDNCSDGGDYGFESNWICDIKHVHNLQHLLKDFEIEKEIVL